MLVKCPECDLQVSDKAIECPHCGYPLKPEKANKPRKRSNKRKRLPNGFGQISEIKGKSLRKPFRAMVTVGKNEHGRPICKLLKPEAYFETYNDAYTALLDYNRKSSKFKKDITIGELYDMWYAEYVKTVRSKTTIKGLASTWKYCRDVYDVSVQEFGSRHLRACLEDSFIEQKNGILRRPTPIMKQRIKNTLAMMLDYAIQYEYIDPNCARNYKIVVDVAEKDKEVKNAHQSFTDEEMSVLWRNVDAVPEVDMIIIQCYTVWRPGELVKLTRGSVNIDDQYIIGGSKTESGRNRIVPIHPKIKEIVINRYRQCTNDDDFLFDIQSYAKYHKRFEEIINILDLNPKHRPHDPRKHFVSMAKRYDVDEYAIKYIVGHRIKDITERVYTDRNIDWLKTEMSKIESL